MLLAWLRDTTDKSNLNDSQDFLCPRSTPGSDIPGPCFYSHVVSALLVSLRTSCIPHQCPTARICISELKSLESSKEYICSISQRIQAPVSHVVTGFFTHPLFTALPSSCYVTPPVLVSLHVPSKPRVLKPFLCGLLFLGGGSTETMLFRKLRPSPVLPCTPVGLKIQPGAGF